MAREVSVPEPVEALPSSFEDCYRLQFDTMARLAFLLSGSRETAQDVAQDAFVGLHRRWSRVENPVGYLRRSVVNGCHSHHRRLRVERRHAQAAHEPVTAFAADELADALAALPTRQRSALVLRFYLDLPDAEIATALGCRTGTVASLVHRGLAQLRKDIDR